MKSIKPFGDSSGFGKGINCSGREINHLGKEINCLSRVSNGSGNVSNSIFLHGIT